MSEDFNPGKYEQPDYAKDEVNSARTGFGLLLLVCFTIGQSVASFSRIPGTAGPFFVVAQLLCTVGQAVYYQAVAESVQQQDAIGIAIPMLLQLVWFAWTIVATFKKRTQGYEPYPSQPGVGILYRIMQSQRLIKINFASDLLIGGLISAGCFLLMSPILGRWYLVATSALIFTHCWMDWIEKTELRRMNDARRRANQWSSRLRQSQGR